MELMVDTAGVGIQWAQLVRQSVGTVGVGTVNVSSECRHCRCRQSLSITGVASQWIISIGTGSLCGHGWCGYRC